MRSTSLRQHELWFRHGRTIPGQPAAALRYRAHRQKLQLRALQAAAPRLAGNTAFPRAAPGTIWTPLGPAASGLGRHWTWGAGLRSGRRPRHRRGGRSRRRHRQHCVHRRSLWRGLEVQQCRPCQRQSLKCYLDSSNRRSADSRRGSNRHSAPTGKSQTPTNSVILVGTGETNSSSDSYYGLGILRSADAGSTWTLISQDSGNRPFAGLGFSQIAFSTVNPSLVVAAAAGATQGVIEGLEDPVIANRGLYYSNDGG